MTFLGTTSFAQNNKKTEGLINKLLAPGPLMLGHEKLEHTDCLTCHEPAGGIPNDGCVDCHKGVGSQVKAKKSFHGQMGKRLCVDCHKDHKGRDHISVKFDEKNFDHNRTGFELSGSHSNVDCKKCHTKKRTDKPIFKSGTRYWGTSPSCKECHADDDIHKFEGKFANKECSTCHITTEWKDVTAFDHKKETGYPLIGAHKKQACSKCHVKQGKDSVKYKFPSLESKKCLTCHEDHHKSNLSSKFRGGNCASCHNQVKWPIDNFKHEVTSFPLRGQHARNNCIDCHKSNSASSSKKFYNWTGLNKACGTCHEDFHGFAGRKPFKMASLKDCGQCHTDLGWKNQQTFNHTQQTRFPLEGKHLQNDCFQCHVTQKAKSERGRNNEPRIYHFKNLTVKSCETCHKSPHSEKFHRRFKGAKCATCHTALGWDVRKGTSGAAGGDRSFHQKTRFPLTGMHKSQSCKSCHLVNGKERYKFPNAKKGFCVNCHNTVHKKQFSPKFLGKGCGDCHTTSSFGKRKEFNHNSTDFKITGKHKPFEKNCVKCHVPTKSKLATKPPKVAHKFKFKFAKNGFCENCHSNVHKGQFSPRFIKASACSDCHSTQTFTKRKIFNHNKNTRFKLTGRHASFKNNCFKCHVKTRKMLPTKPPKVAHKFVFAGAKKGFCENCHKNEHKDMFSAKFYRKPCGECHKTTRWRHLKDFDHRKTAFPLRYKHRKVDCKECHKPTSKRFKQGTKRRKGRYKFPALESKNCAMCHTDVHKGANGKNCRKCHTEAGWENAEGFHKDFHLVGVHLTLSCDQCHVANKVLRGSSDDCRVCHSVDDPHQGFLPDCGQCHTQTVWPATTFSHDMTQFPLRGVHRLTDCKSCHGQGNFEALPSDCKGCHAQDAAAVTAPDHSGERYQPCEQCHNTFSFSGSN